MAMVLLLPTETKAEDVYLLCNANGQKWNIDDGLKFTSNGNDEYTLSIQASDINQDGNQLRFRVAVRGWTAEMCPYGTNYDFSTNIANNTVYSITDNCYNDKAGQKDNYFYFDKGTYASYKFTVTLGNSKSIKVEGVSDSGSGGTTTGSDFSEHGSSSNGRGYYLVSVNHDKGSSTDNIFAEDETLLEDENHKVYYNRILRFNDNGNGTYTMAIPATITGKIYVEEISSSNESMFYGPNTSDCVIKNIDAEASGTLTSANTEESINVWSVEDRGNEDGLYIITIYLGKDGNPVDWAFDYNADRRVSYFLSTAELSSANAIYDNRETHQGRFANTFKSDVYFDDNENTNYYVISNIVKNSNYVNYAKNFDNTVTENRNGGADILPTVNKLLLLGNGGNSFKSYNPNNEFSPNEKPMKTSASLKGLCHIEYNPSNGNDGYVSGNHYGIRGQLIFNGGDKDGVSMAIVGPLFENSMKEGEINYEYLSGEGEPNNVMKYNDTKHCYELEIVTTNEQEMKDFVFVANKNKNNIWYETNRPVRDPYYAEDATGMTSAATAQDPNHVKNGTSADDNFKYIQFNRPAGKWTISFYFVNTTMGTQYYYTISSEESIPVEIPVKKDKDGKTYVLRTFSYGADLVPDDENVHIYAAQKFSENGKDDYTGTITGQVHLYEISYVPADEGVVLFYKNAEETKEVTFRLASEYNTKEYPKCRSEKKLRWVEQDGKTEEYNNDLMQVLEDKFVEQSVYDESHETIIARNFGLNFFSNTIPAEKLNKNSYNDYIGFFRLRGTVYANQAYLQYDNNEVKDNAQIFGQTTDKVQLEKDEDATKDTKLAIIFEGCNDYETNGINGITVQENKSADDYYYNLQGIRVAKPNKGIYIHNGKKVIIK